MSTPQFEHAELVNEVTVIPISSLERLIEKQDGALRVRRLHGETNCPCTDDGCGTICRHCISPFPCLTIQALNGEQA